MPNCRLSTNELGANIAIAPPDHLASLLDGIVAGKNQDEFIGNVEPYDIQPRAFFGNI